MQVLNAVICNGVGIKQGKQDMINLFKRTKENKKKDDQEQYMNYVVRVAFPALRKGNIGYVDSLQRVFTIKDARHYHIEISKLFTDLFQHTSVKGLIRLDEQCRHHVYEEYAWQRGDIDWYSKKLSHKEMPYLSQEQYVAVLRLGTYHSNGYFRQSCMEELAQYDGSLPFLVMRLNDWVEEIRNCAYGLVLYRIRICNIQELFSAIPMFDKVRNSRRRDMSQLTFLERQVQQQIGEKFRDCNINEIHNYDITVKNAIYRFINQNKILELNQMQQLCALEKDGYGKRLLILGIFAQFDCTQDMIYGYLSDKSAVVRYHALEFYYEKRKTAWDGLEKMLLDKSKRIRSNVSYILKRHSDFDVLSYYKEYLDKQDHTVAILGVGENGSKEDVDMIVPYLESGDERFVKAALQAYGMIMREQGEEIYWQFLLNSSIVLAAQAYRLIKSHDIHYGAKVLYETYQENQHLPAAEYFILLLIKESSWSSLPYVLQLYDAETLSEKIRKYVQASVYNRNMYATVSKEQAQNIKDILEMKRDSIPEMLYKGILMDLKYVTKKGE